MCLSLSEKGNCEIILIFSACAGREIEFFEISLIESRLRKQTKILRNVFLEIYWEIKILIGETYVDFVMHKTCNRYIIQKEL